MGAGLAVGGLMGGSSHLASQQLGGVRGMTTGVTMAGSSGPSRDREVILDKTTGRLVDVGGGQGGYQYTTLQDTMAFIRAYRPATVARS